MSEVEEGGRSTGKRRELKICGFRGNERELTFLRFTSRRKYRKMMEERELTGILGSMISKTGGKKANGKMRKSRIRKREVKKGGITKAIRCSGKR